MDPHASVIADLLDRREISPNNALHRAELLKLGHQELNAIWQAIGRYYLGDKYVADAYIWTEKPAKSEGVCLECYGRGSHSSRRPAVTM